MVESICNADELYDRHCSPPSPASCQRSIETTPVSIEGAEEYVNNATKAVEPTFMPSPFLSDSSLTENSKNANKHKAIIHDVPAHPLDVDLESNGKKI